MRLRSTSTALVGRTLRRTTPARAELLGQHEPEPVGRLDGPASLRKVDRPFEESLDLMTVRLHRQLGERCLFFVDCHGSVGCLVRVDADEHHRVPPCLWWEPRRAVLMRPVCSPLSSHAVAKELGADTSDQEANPQAAGCYRARPPSSRDARTEAQRRHNHESG